MGLYKYVTNNDPQDGTAEIRLPGRNPVPVGGEVELSKEEYDLLKTRLNLRAVGTEKGQGNQKGEESPVSAGREGGEK